MSTSTSHRLLSLLPAIYRDDEFLGRYLSGFEETLLDFEQKIDSLSTLFDPMTAREDFLPWLSSWVAFSIRADLAVDQKRSFLSRIVPLYARRGTLLNLQELLGIFIHGTPTVVESDDPFHFHVSIQLPQAPPAVLLRQSTIAHALIDMEKPAHTFYDLELIFPTMQIGVTSHVGVDTLLGAGH